MTHLPWPSNSIVRPETESTVGLFSSAVSCSVREPGRAFAALGRRLVRMRDDDRGGLDDVVRDVRARRHRDRAQAQIQHQEVGLVEVRDDRLHVGVHRGVAREVHDQPVGEADDVARGRAERQRQVVRLEVLALGLAQQAACHGAVVRRRHDRDLDGLGRVGGLERPRPAQVVAREAGGRERHRVVVPARADRARRRRLAGDRLDALAEEVRHLVDHHQPGVLRRGDLRGRRVRRGGRERGQVAGSRLERGQALVAHVVAVRVAQEHDVDGAEARVAAAEHRLAGVVEDADAGRILEDHRAVAVAKLAVVRAERDHLDVLGRAYAGEGREHQRHEAAQKR